MRLSVSAGNNERQPPVPTVRQGRFRLRRTKHRNIGEGMTQKLLAATCAAFASLACAHAQQPDQDYMKRVMPAAPPQIVADATVVRMQNGAMQTLKKGTNSGPA